MTPLMKDWRRWVGGAALLVLIAILFVDVGKLISTAIVAMNYPYDLDYGEGIVWQQMDDIVAGKGYAPLGTFPAIVYHYPPVYHLVVAGVRTGNRSPRRRAARIAAVDHSVDGDGRMAVSRGLDGDGSHARRDRCRRRRVGLWHFPHGRVLGGGHACRHARDRAHACRSVLHRARIPLPNARAVGCAVLRVGGLYQADRDTRADRCVCDLVRRRPSGCLAAADRVRRDGSRRAPRADRHQPRAIPASCRHLQRQPFRIRCSAGRSSRAASAHSRRIMGGRMGDFLLSQLHFEFSCPHPTARSPAFRAEADALVAQMRAFDSYEPYISGARAASASPSTAAASVNIAS